MVVSGVALVDLLCELRIHHPQALREYLAHSHAERNHQGKDNVLLFPTATKAVNHIDGSVGCKERLGGLLKYYHREAA
jgi:putative transposase